MLVKFRAECQFDVDRLLLILPKTCLMSYKVNPSIIKDKGRIIPVPDVECVMDVEHLTLSDLRDIMAHISDSHVMQQTLTLESEFTGIRDYKDYYNHKERHLFLHRGLIELMADYMIQTGISPSSTTLEEFNKWSILQTLAPVEIDYY